MSLRIKLSLFFLVLLLGVLACISWLTLAVSRNTLRGQTLQQLDGLVAMQQARLQACLEDYYNRLRLISSRTRMRELLALGAAQREPAQVEQLCQILDDARTALPDILELTLITDGRIVASTRRPLVGRLAVIDTALRPREQGPRLDKVSSRHEELAGPHLQFAMPITQATRELGLLRMVVTMDRLTPIMGDFTGLGRTGETMLVMRGTQALLPLTPLRFDTEAALRRSLPESLPRDPVAQVMRQREDLLDGNATDYRGERVLAAGRYLRGPDWGLVVKLDRAEAEGPVAEFQRQVQWLSLALATLLLLISLVASRWITTPLAQITALATRIRTGDLRSRLEWQRKDELGMLAQSFNSMAESLLQARHELERRITERTAELTAANTDLRHEIAQREKITKALQESESQLRRTVTNAPLPIMIHDDADTLTLVSQAWEQIAGYRREEAPTLTAWAGKVFPSAPAEALSQLRAAFSAGDAGSATAMPKAVELALRARNGEQRLWECYSAPLGTATNGRRLVVTMAMDVTQRRLAEQALMKDYDKLELWVSERTAELRRAKELLEGEIQQRRWAEEELVKNAEHLRIFVERLPIAVAMLDHEVRYLMVSRLWLSEHDLEDAYIIGRRYYDVMPEPDAATLAIHQRCLAGQVERREEERHLREDGRVEWLHWEIHPWQRRTGEIGGLIMFNEVITERKLAQEQLARKARDLARSNQELEHFAYVASHDLQEPLRVITSFVQLLQRRYRDKLDETAHQYIAFAVDGAARMRQLIADLLAYSRVGTQDRTANTIDAGSALQAALNNLATAIAESQAEVNSGELPRVTGDTTQVVQLFQNLVGNAIKYRHPDRPPVITVTASREAADYHFIVRDNGIGIDPKYHERIFKVFERLHTREEYPGTGIGLAICQKIVENHGGRIWVTSNPDAGVSFCFTWPASVTERVALSA